MASQKTHHWLALLVALFSVMFATGCLVVPIKTGTHIQNVSGKKDALPKFEIVPGKTTRQQVEEQYKTFALDSGAPNLFWGRFRKSTWAMVAGVGGYGGGTAGAGRMWGSFNLLVGFDSNGSVKTLDTVQDKDLFGRLQTMCKEHDFAAFGPSPPVKLKAWQVTRPYTPVELLLSEGGIKIIKHRPDRKIHKEWVVQPPLVAFLAASEIPGIKVDPSDNLDYIPVTLRFTGKTPVGERLSFTALPSSVVTLSCWQQQVQAAVRPNPSSGKGSNGAASEKRENASSGADNQPQR
jgi:hypothetical protein